MRFNPFKRPSLSMLLRRWASDARQSEQDYLHEAESKHAESVLLATQAKNAQAMAAMYAVRAQEYEDRANALDADAKKAAEIAAAARPLGGRASA